MALLFVFTVWPSEEDMQQSVQVKASDVSSQLVATQWRSEDVSWYFHSLIQLVFVQMTVCHDN